MIVGKLLESLIASMRIRPPRKKSLRKAYYELCYKTELKGKFDAYWAEKGSMDGFKMSERNKFLDRAMEAEPQSVHDQLKAYIEGDYKIALEGWNRQKDGCQHGNGQ